VKVDFVNPFVGSAFSVLQMVIGDSPKRGELAARTKLFKSQPVTIVIGVVGAVHGQVLYGMSQDTARRLSGAMIGQEVLELDELAISALAELGNMITGNAASQLAQAGYVADLAPPAVIQGPEIIILTVEAALVVPVITGCGVLEINIALEEGRQA